MKTLLNVTNAFLTHSLIFNTRFVRLLIMLKYQKQSSTLHVCIKSLADVLMVLNNLVISSLLHLYLWTFISNRIMFTTISNLFTIKPLRGDATICFGKD